MISSIFFCGLAPKVSQGGPRDSPGVPPGSKLLPDASQMPSQMLPRGFPDAPDAFQMLPNLKSVAKGCRFSGCRLPERRLPEDRLAEIIKISSLGSLAFSVSLSVVVPGCCRFCVSALSNNYAIVPGQGGKPTVDASQMPSRWLPHDSQMIPFL